MARLGRVILDLDALLLHRIAVANGNTAILLGLEIDSDFCFSNA